MAKRLTNEQAVARMMKGGKTGAMAQIFIVEAICKYAKACAAADPAVLDNPMISGAAWVATARDLCDQLVGHGYMRAEEVPPAFSDAEREKSEARAEQMGATADRVDGYDRDDLGESHD